MLEMQILALGDRFAFSHTVTVYFHLFKTVQKCLQSKLVGPYVPPPICLPKGRIISRSVLPSLLQSALICILNGSWPFV